MSKRHLQTPGNSPSSEQLGELLRTLTPPRKTEGEWDHLREGVFEALDCRAPARSSHTQSTLSFILPWITFIRRPSVVSAVLGIIVLSVITSYYAGRPGDIPAVVLRTQGEAQVLSKGQSSGEHRWWKQTEVSSPVRQNQVFQTGENASLSLGLEKATGLELAASSALGIEELNTETISLFLYRGSVTAEVSPRDEGQEFVITTPNAELRVVGTAFRVDVELDTEENDVQTLLTVMRGEVTMATRLNVDQAVAIKEGHRLVSRGTNLQRPQRVFEEEDAMRELRGLRRALSRFEPENKIPLGLLRVTSQPPGAEVYVDGTPEGTTPLALLLSEGDRKLSLNYLNYEPFDTTVLVQSDTDGKIGIRLDQKSAIEEQPDSAESGRTTVPERPQRTVKTRKQEEKRDKVSIEVVEKDPVPELISRVEYQRANKAKNRGDYSEALAQLELLLEQARLSDNDRLQILDEIVKTAKRLGDYNRAVRELEKMYALVDTGRKKDILLWEMITIKVDRLRTYHEVEMDLVEYMVTQPNGIWRYEAYQKLAEVQYLLDKPRAAARTYEKLIQKFGREEDLDAALYALAHVLRHDLKIYEEAVRWYSRLIKEFPRSTHLEDAVFWRAECLWKLGRISQANEEFRKYAELFPQGRWRQAVRQHLGPAAAQ